MISRFGRNLGLAAWLIRPRSHVIVLLGRELVSILCLARLPQIIFVLLYPGEVYQYRFFLTVFGIRFYLSFFSRKSKIIR